MVTISSARRSLLLVSELRGPPTETSRRRCAGAGTRGGAVSAVASRGALVLVVTHVDGRGQEVDLLHHLENTRGDLID